MDKTDFIISINNIINNVQVDDSIFESILGVLKLQGTISENYIIDTNKNQSQNLILAVSQKTIQFFGVYLGQ